jgi:hypothetical protein
MEHLRYPDESDEYRAARNALLEDEMALMAHIEAVAAERRGLPQGEKSPRIMYLNASAKRGRPSASGYPSCLEHITHSSSIVSCTVRSANGHGCTHLLNGIDGAARHIGQRAALHVVAKSPIAWLLGRTNGAGSICPSCRRRGIAMTQIILGTRRRFRKECARSISLPMARIGTKLFSTSFAKRAGRLSLLEIRNELCPSGAKTASPSRGSC